MKKKTRTRTAGFRTLLVHAGEEPDPFTGAIAPVLVRSKTFAQQRLGVEPLFQYSRGANPTRLQLERKLAELEGGGYASVFASGVAAEAMLFLTLSPGDHILFCQEVYGGTYRLLSYLTRFGIRSDFVDFGDENAVCSAITPNTKFLFAETPTNPSLHIVDLTAASCISRKHGIPLVVDGTFAPPCTTRAFEFGAETVVHSLSKYIAGHNDVLGGAVITKNKVLHERLLFLQKTVGAVLSPDECYRVLQEVKTLSMRFEYVSNSALQVAEFLLRHPGVKRVLYPGLASHPGYPVARVQMKHGFGGVLSFELRRQELRVLRKFVSLVRKHSPILFGESLASPETLLAYPPLMSHKSLPAEVRRSLGISDGFFRLSLGFEDVEDILCGFARALEALGR